MTYSDTVELHTESKNQLQLRFLAVVLIWFTVYWWLFLLLVLLLLGFLALGSLRLSGFNLCCGGFYPWWCCFWFFCFYGCWLYHFRGFNFCCGCFKLWYLWFFYSCGFRLCCSLGLSGFNLYCCGFYLWCCCFWVFFVFLVVGFDVVCSLVVVCWVLVPNWNSL